MDRKSQQNLRDARTYFNADLTKDKKDRYKDYRIDSESFERGKQDGYNNDIQVIPENMKENFSYVSGFNHAKRELKVQKDMYKMGQEYFLSGRNFDDAHENYKNNGYFVQGFKDAMDIKLNNDTTIRRSGR
jgi:hypothetical protein